MLFMLTVVKNIYAKCHYAECRYIKCCCLNLYKKLILSTKKNFPRFFRVRASAPAGVTVIKPFWTKFTNSLCKLHVLIVMQQINECLLNSLA